MGTDVGCPNLPQMSQRRSLRHDRKSDDSHLTCFQFVLRYELDTLLTTISLQPDIVRKSRLRHLMQLIFTRIWANFTIIGITICAFTVDRIGRVLALKSGWIGDLLAMIGVVVSLAKFEQTGSRASAIAALPFCIFILLWMPPLWMPRPSELLKPKAWQINELTGPIVFTLPRFSQTTCAEKECQSPLEHSSLCWSSNWTVHRLRSPTLAGGKTSTQTSFPSTEVDEFARIILIYLCCLAAFIPFLWVICPETKGKSLEEISIIFGDRHVHIALEGPEVPEETVQVSEKQVHLHVSQEHEHIERLI